MFRSRKLSYSYPSTTGQFNADYADLPLKKLLVNIPVTQTGSGTPSPDNIRDIVGVQGVNVSRTGKNLLDDSNKNIGGYNIWFYGDSSTYKFWKAGTYMCSAVFSSAGISVFYTLQGASLSTTIMTTSASGLRNLSFTIPQDGYYRIFAQKTGGITYDDVINPMIAISNDLTYEPYTGNTYTISFGQTVYSANLDVLNGKLSVTHIRKALSDLEWAIVTDATSGFGYDYFRSSGNIEDMKDFIGVLCDCLTNNNHTQGDLHDNEIGKYNSANYGKRLVCRVDSITTIEDWNTFIADKYIVYELATPIEIPLGGIDIKTLQGVNNIFADIGTVETQCIKLGN